MTTDDLPIPTTDDPGPFGRAEGGTRLRVRLSAPGDLVAAVPHLLGFRPADSLVLVALVPGTGSTRFQVGGVVRADLTAPAHVATVVAACVRRLGVARPSELALVVIGGGNAGGDGSPPRADVVDEVEAMCAAVRVPVHARVWVPRVVGGERWRCYPPCGCSGRVASSDDSVMAMASTLVGQVVYGSREAMESTLAPLPQASGARMQELLTEAFEAAVLDRELGGQAAGIRDLRVVQAAVDEVAAGRVLGDAELARVAVALRDPRVRDSCLSWSIEERAVPAEQLWTMLVRAIPPPEVAEPATLLAFSVTARGGGALVGAALERAQRAEPGHTLSGLLGELLARGVGQEAIVELVRESGASARELVEGLSPPAPHS